MITKMTPELARFIAYVIADGYFSKEKQTIGFTKWNEKIVADFVKCTKQLFGIDYVSVKEDKLKNTIIVKVYSASLIEFLDKIGLKGKGLNKLIPDCIMCSSLENKANFLRAYLDCDGCFSNHSLTVASISDRNIQSIHCLLKEFNLGSTICKLKSTGFGKHPFYVLRVNNVKKYFNICSSSRFKYESFNERELVGDVKFFRIKSIQVEDYEGDYYDVSVKENENFFTGTIGFLLSKNSPTMLNNEIYSDIKHFFIYRCSNTEVLGKYIPDRRIMDRIKHLDFKPDRNISQCLHVPPDRDQRQAFFPFNSPINNQ